MILKTSDPDLLSIVATLAAIDMAKGMDMEEQNIFANILSLMASVIATIASVEQAKKSAAEAKDKEIPAKTAAKVEAGAEGGAGPDGYGLLPHAPVTPHGAVEGHARLLAEQAELRRQVEELERAVRELAARAREG